MENTERLSFILTVNLNLDEVQCRPCLCFKTKGKLLSLKLGWALWWMSEWNTGGKKTWANFLNLPQWQFIPNISKIQMGKCHSMSNNIVSCVANSKPGPLPCSSCLHFNTTIHKCYTHVSDRLLRSIHKRKFNHLSIGQALERAREGEKTHTHSYINML